MCSLPSHAVLQASPGGNWCAFFMSVTYFLMPFLVQGCSLSLRWNCVCAVWRRLFSDWSASSVRVCVCVVRGKCCGGNWSMISSDNVPVPGAADMGAKQSVLGNFSLGQSPTLENIQAAYRDGESGRAQDLIRISCKESGGLRPERVRDASSPLSLNESVVFCWRWKEPGTGGRERDRQPSLIDQGGEEQNSLCPEEGRGEWCHV